MRKLLVILGAVLLVSASALWANGQKEGGGAPVTVSYMTWDSGKGLEITQSAVDAFQKKYPNVTVELQSVPEGYDDKVMTANAAGNTPDGLLMWNTSQFAEAGVVENLSPYIARDGFDMGQYLPVLKSWSTYNGAIWGLPKDYTPRAIYYNKKVFDQAGVAYPQAGWTWADFTDIVKKLTNGKTGADARYGYVAIPGHTYAIQSYIWMNGGDLCSPDGKTASGYINSPAVAEVVKWYKGLFDMSVSTGTMDAYQNLGQTEFQSGHCRHDGQRDVAPCDVPGGHEPELRDCRSPGSPKGRRALPHYPQRHLVRLRQGQAQGCCMAAGQVPRRP